MVSVERVEAQAITRIYGGKAALRNVTAVFPCSEITFVEGPNGAGKSTLLGVVGTRIRPTSGEVRYVSPSGNSVNERAELGWLSHELRLYPDLTGRENVELAARLHGVADHANWDRIACRLGIEEFDGQPVRTLSRGQRQRIALARALVHEPGVVLLDEPLTGLDTESVERVATVLAEERARGAVVIVVNHTAGFADRVGGRRLRLERGRVVGGSAASGSVATL